MTEYMTRDRLNGLFQSLISQLCEEKGRSKEQSKRRATPDAEKYPSRVHLTSDKGQLLIVFTSKNIPTVRNMERAEEVIILKK